MPGKGKTLTGLTGCDPQPKTSLLLPRSVEINILCILRILVSHMIYKVWLVLLLHDSKITCR